MFQQPREITAVPVSEMVGSLVLFIVHRYRTGINTSFGNDKDAVECDIYCLDGQHAGEAFPGGLIFQGALIGSLKGYAGSPEPVLGRIGLGDAKPKQNPPYLLIPFTQADAAIAGPAWARIQAGQFRAPAQNGTAPAAPAQQYAPVPQQQYQAPPVPQPAAAPPAAATRYQAAASPATGNYQPQAAPAQQYQPAPPAAQPSEADKFMAYPPEVQLVLIQSGQAPALTQEQFNALTVPIQQALQPAAV